MRTFFAICRQYLREQRLATLVWLGVMAVMAYGVVSAAPSMVRDNTITRFAESMPDALRRLMGDMLRYKHPVDVYLEAKLLSFMPLLTAIFGVLSAMGIVAREVDRRNADFVMTLPVSRSKILLARFAAVALNVALLYAVTLFVIWAGLASEKVAASLGGYAMFFTGSYFVAMLMAAAALFLSLRIEDYTRANRTVLITVVALYVLHLANVMADGPAWLGKVFLFGWVNSVAVVADGRFPLGAVVAGALATGLALIAAVRAFDHKQIPA